MTNGDFYYYEQGEADQVINLGTRTLKSSWHTAKFLQHAFLSKNACETIIICRCIIL